MQNPNPQVPADSGHHPSGPEATLDHAIELLNEFDSPAETTTNTAASQAGQTQQTAAPRISVGESKIRGINVDELLKNSIQEGVSFLAMLIVASGILPMTLLSLVTIATGTRPDAGWIANLAFLVTVGLYGMMVGLESRKTNMWFRIGFQLTLFTLVGGLAVLGQQIPLASSLLPFAAFAGTFIACALLFKRMAKESNKEAEDETNKPGWRVLLEHAKGFGTAILVVSCVLYAMMFAQGAAQARLYNGKPAPATVYLDQQDQPWTFAQHHGKVILVEFWAPYCAPCLKSFPHFHEINEKYSERDDFVMVSVSSGDRERSIETFNSFDASWPLLFQPEQSSDEDLQPFSIPAAYVIDQSGNVVASSIRGKKIDKTLESLLK